MNGLARIAGLALLGCTVALDPFGTPTVIGQSPPERLITDTPEYCAQLIERVHQAERARGRPAPQDARVLSEEGELMCDHGEVRGGILRLRRAMQIMLGASQQ